MTVDASIIENPPLDRVGLTDLLAADWTYFVQSIDGGPIKIGFTSQTPDERLANLQTGSPVQLRIVGLLRGNREREMHQRFRQYRLQGEWFSVSKDLLTFIDEEAETVRCEHVKATSRVRLEGRAVRITDATTKYVGPSWFDRVITNNDDLSMELLGAHDWESEEADTEALEEDKFYDDDETSEDIECEVDVIQAICDAVSEESFVESIGLNAACGWLCFNCGPCNSRKRFGILESLAGLAVDMDGITGHWFMFAIFWDRGRQVGINLLRLGMDGTKGDEHLFDPMALCVDVEGG